jgi:hypothetical protein
MGILNGGADFGKQAVHGSRKLGHGIADDARRRTGEIALLYCQQPIAKRGKGASTFAVRAFRRDVADQQAECTGNDRGDDLLVEAGNVDKCGEGKQERGNASRARKQGVANLLSRSFYRA